MNMAIRPDDRHHEGIDLFMRRQPSAASGHWTPPMEAPAYRGVGVSDTHSSYWEGEGRQPIDRGGRGCRPDAWLNENRAAPSLGKQGNAVDRKDRRNDRRRTQALTNASR